MHLAHASASSSCLAALRCTTSVGVDSSWASQSDRSEGQLTVIQSLAGRRKIEEQRDLRSYPYAVNQAHAVRKWEQQMRVLERL